MRRCVFLILICSLAVGVALATSADVADADSGLSDPQAGVESAGEPIDPVRVLVDHPYCDSGVLQVERYRRAEADWVKHARFPVLAAGTCIVEDAGGLLNEVRTRCFPLDIEDQVEAWRIGIPVFQPGVIDVCKLPEAGALRVEIRRPASGVEVTGKATKIEVRGVVERVGQGGTDRLQWLGVENLSLQTEPAPIRVDGSGNFIGTIELGPGPNHVRVTARDLAGATASHGVAVMFDAGAARARARASEQERMDGVRSLRERTKSITIEQAPVDASPP